MDKKYSVSYATAVNYVGGSLVLCNNVVNVDEDLFCNGEEMNIYEQNEDGEDVVKEFYQFYITSWGVAQARFVGEHFDLAVVYSEVLDAFILCVDHLGMGWDYVEISTDLEELNGK